MKSRNSVPRKSSVALILLVMIASLASACGKKAENSSNEVGVLKKSLNVADETAAVRTLQNIFRAEAQYMTIHSGSYGTFDELVKDGSLDQRFASSAPVLEGYIFTIKLTPDAGGQAMEYSINADPKDGAQAGARHLYMDSTSNVVRANQAKTATVNDPPLQ